MIKKLIYIVHFYKLGNELIERTNSTNISRATLKK